MPSSDVVRASARADIREFFKYPKSPEAVKHLEAAWEKLRSIGINVDGMPMNRQGAMRMDDFLRGYSESFSEKFRPGIERNIFQ